MKAVQSVDSANHEKEDEDDLDDDDISVLEPEPLSPIEATEAMRALRNFVITFDKSGAKEREFLRSLVNGGHISKDASRKTEAIHTGRILPLNINCCWFLRSCI